MTRVDVTAIGIVVGLVVSAAYAALRGIRQRSLDILQTVLVFLAAFTLPAGTYLLRASISGRVGDLPADWRLYVVVAGIVCVGLAGQHVIRAAKEAWTRQPRGKAGPGDPDADAD